MAQNINKYPRRDRLIFKNIIYYSEHHEFLQGDLEIYGHRIVRLSKTRPLSKRHNKNVTHASSLVCFPGLVNAHLHPSKEIYGGIKAYSSITEVLDTVHKNDFLETEKLQSLASKYCFLKLLRQGVTTFGVFTSRAEVDAQQALETKIRAAIHFSQNDHWVGKETKPSIESRKKIVNRYHDCVRKYETQRITIHPATATELTATQDLMQTLYTIAVENKKRFAMHLSEGKSQVTQCLSVYKKTGPELLNEYHMLGPELLLIHAASLFEKDINLLKQKKVNYVHCPVSNSFTGSGKFPLKIMSENNTIALGTDAAMVNPFNNLVFDAAFCLYFHGESNLNDKVSAPFIVDSLTRAGSVALGFKDLGYIKEGMLADLCFYDREDIILPSPHPALSFLNTMMHAIPLHVMINGEYLIYNKIILGQDFNSIKKNFINHFTKVRSES